MAGLLFSEIYIVIPAEPARAPAPWLDPAVGAAALAVAAFLAWRRVRRRDLPPPRRAERIATTVATFAATGLVMLAPGVLGDAGRLALRLPFEPVVALGIGFAALALLGLLLFVTADFLLDALRPHRTRLWLVLAPPLMAAFVVGLFVATGWFDAAQEDGRFSLPMLGTAAAAAGLTWWSRLPKPGELVSSIFS
jgi:predicted permease